MTNDVASMVTRSVTDNVTRSVTDNIDESIKKNVLICDTQPVAVEGMKWLIENSGDLQFAGSVYALQEAYDLLNPGAARVARELAALAVAQSVSEALANEASANEIYMSETLAAESCEAESCERETPGAGTIDGEAQSSGLFAVTSQAADENLTIDEPHELEGPPVPIDAIVIDKGLGLTDVMELLQKLASTSHPTPAVVWGSAISEPEALRLLQAGARGILRRTSESGTLLTCLRAVTSGGTWMEDGIFGSTEKLYNRRRSELTHRESEVVLLVEKGLRNRDIARMLGIQTGTVKIHLKHIFEKTGVRGRYGLALTGLQNKGSITLSPPPQFTV